MGFAVRHRNRDRDSEWGVFLLFLQFQTPVHITYESMTLLLPSHHIGAATAIDT